MIKTKEDKIRDDIREMELELSIMKQNIPYIIESNQQFNISMAGAIVTMSFRKVMETRKQDLEKNDEI